MYDAPDMADPGSLSDIIDVTITLADAEVQRDGFSGVMLVSEHEVGSPARVQTYTGKKADVLAAMVADGFTAGQTITLAVAQNSDQGVLGRAATTTIVR